MITVPNEHEIYDKISKIIAEALRINPAKISPDSKIFDELGAESLDIIDIRFRIEREFGFKIDQGEIFHGIGQELSADDIKNKFTVGSVVDFVKYRLQTEIKGS